MKQKKCDFESVLEMVPFLSHKYVAALVELEEDKFSGPFPFVSKEKLKQMAKKAYDNRDMKTLISLAPFTSDGLLDQLTVKNFEGDLDLDLIPLYQFLQKSTLEGLAERMFKENKMKEISSIVSFFLIREVDFVKL